MTGANVGITVNNGSADTARVTAAGLADLTTLEVGDATGGTGELTAANGNLTTAAPRGDDTSITDDFTITDSNGAGTSDDEVLLSVEMGAGTTANRGAMRWVVRH